MCIPLYKCDNLILHMLFHWCNPEMTCFCDLFSEKGVSLNKQWLEALNETVFLKAAYRWGQFINMHIWVYALLFNTNRIRLSQPVSEIRWLNNFQSAWDRVWCSKPMIYQTSGSSSAKRFTGSLNAA